MNVVKTILLVAFVIVCVLLVLLVLVQNENSNGMGSAFGGGQSAAFGAKSASVLTKTTAVLATLFLVLAFSLSLVNKIPSEDISAAVESVQGSAPAAAADSDNWLEKEVAPKSE